MKQASNSGKRIMESEFKFLQVDASNFSGPNFVCELVFDQNTTFSILAQNKFQQKVDIFLPYRGLLYKKLCFKTYPRLLTGRYISC